MKFKSKQEFSKKELEKLLKWIKEWDEYRGGMLNRVDGLHILEWINRELRKVKRMSSDK